MREKMIELCEDVILSCKASLCADCEHSNIDYPHCMGVHFADYLLANGVVVREKGEWIGEGDGYADGEIVYDVWYCPECNHCIDDGVDDPALLPNFCPNCGADMTGGDRRV